jgi:hypothetical protein
MYRIEHWTMSRSWPNVGNSTDDLTRSNTSWNDASNLLWHWLHLKNEHKTNEYILVEHRNELVLYHLHVHSMAMACPIRRRFVVRVVIIYIMAICQTTMKIYISIVNHRRRYRNINRNYWQQLIKRYNAKAINYLLTSIRTISIVVANETMISKRNFSFNVNYVHVGCTANVLV